MAQHPKPYRMLRDVLDLALQTGAPLIVRRRCNPHQLAVWMAVRFLIDTTERTAFGSREIADEAGLKSYPRVAGWLDDLVALELLEVAGYEEIKGGVIKGVKRNRPIYRIPWKHIFSASLSEGEKYLSGMANKSRRGRPPEGHELQLPLDFPVTDRSLVSDRSVTDSSDRSITGGSDQSVTAPVIDRSQSSDQSVTAPVIDRSHGMDGRMDGRMDGSGASAKKKKGGPPQEAPALPAPDPAPDQPPIPAHPLTLWRNACPRHRPIDDQQLTALASEHDATTGGHGLYWVGRAILAASLNEDVRQVAKVRNILDRWRTEESYGSDLPLQRKRYGRSSQSHPAAHPHGRSGASALSPELDAEYDRLIADAEARGRDEGV